MNTTNYKNCLSVTGLTTGNLLASYNFSNQVDSVILNDLYSTGDCYFNNGSNNVFFSDKSNLNMLESGLPLSSQFTGYFSGNQYGVVQSNVDFRNHDIVLDFSLDNCSASHSKVIMSSSTGLDLSSGMVFGINEANKFFIEYGTGTSKRIHTSKIGVSPNNALNFGVIDSLFYLRKYDFLNQAIKIETFDLDNFSSSDRILFGKSFSNYSGFSGRMNQIFVSLNNSNGASKDCYECLFCTGINQITVSGEQVYRVVEDNLSYRNYIVSGTGITGYENVVVYDNFTNTYVSNPSGVTGSFVVGAFSTGDFVDVTGFFETDTLEVSLDNSLRTDYIDSIKINFIDDLESGDLLEVYDYLGVNPNIGLRNNISFNSDLALFSNGTLMISGLDYDIQNGLVINSFDSSDEIRINKINSPIRYLKYSGLYDSHKKPTGNGSEYYPPQSQFYESGDGNITITGLGGLFYSGFVLSNHDLFMNGQKIYTGIDYETGEYGGEESVIIYAANFNDADLLITTGELGELISLDYQTESILAFCPVQNQQFSRNVIFLTGSLPSYDLLGKGEEVWVNGIKSIEDINYGKVYPCSSYSYNFNIPDLPYIFCNNNDNFFNID